MKAEKRQAHGQLVVDFVNAETVLDACIGLFDNVQKAFNFSTKYKALLEQFRGKKSKFILSLQQEEKDLFVLLKQKEELLWMINCRHLLPYHIIDYDCEKKNLIVIKSDDWDDSDYLRPFNLPIKNKSISGKRENASFLLWSKGPKIPRTRAVFAPRFLTQERKSALREFKLV
jgi:hypothetical protein